MTNQIVTDAQVEKALDWLRDNAEQIGEAKRKAVKCDHMLKHIKAVSMGLHRELPVSAQEREAYASEAYLSAIGVAAEASAEYDTLKAMREAAALKIEVWRSQSANYRAMKL